MKNKIKTFLKSETYQYFEYAMLAFGGLGLEVLYAYLLEPLFYGHSMKEFTTIECIIHWSVTIITWLVVAYLIVRSAKKNLGFQLKGTDSKWSLLGIITSSVLIGLMLVVNYVDVGGLKIIYEFHKLGVLKFIFQHLYYLAEVVLFSLIILFGQNALEKLFGKKNVPYGGIIVGMTWGLAHWFTKGSILIGLEGLVIGFLFGAIYLFLDRDFKKTYIVLALAFII
ncbi:MAG: hypothetical protein IJA10_03500 [Lachnospiraceae bacterium]|nr:hypothetical protein [Lachnospiraceae bacterium]